MPRRLSVVALCLALFLAACGNGNGDNSGPFSDVELRVNTPTAAPTEPPVTPTPEEPAELVLSTHEVYQAGALLVSVTGDVSEGVISFQGREHDLHQGDHSMYSFVGIDIDDPPGPAPLEVRFITPNGSKGSLSADITIHNVEWEVDYLYFEPAEIDEFFDPELERQEAKLLDKTYDITTPEKLWDTPWHTPLEGEITARFGSRRSVNDGPPEGHHSGTDIGAEPGTPIAATNHGRVVMARHLDIRGNTVVIDHGGGVLSAYAHMQEFHVSEGQDVQAGDVVGTVGNTGRSTGPHLHWEIAVNGKLVDPYRFVDGSNGF